MMQILKANVHSPLRGLYAITDNSYGASLHAQVEQALLGGVKLLQYRHKPKLSGQSEKTMLDDAHHLRKLTMAHDACLIINDDVALCQTVAADGVHLGKEDGNVELARALLGKQAIIGVSCYCSAELGQKAVEEGASYLAFGAAFSSLTKPQAEHCSMEKIAELRAQFQLPVCVIGGINQSNLDEVKQSHVDMFALVGGLFDADDVRTRAEQLIQCWQLQG